MFESRRSCTLSHVRFKKDAEFTAYDLAAGEHMEDDNTMLAIAQVFHDFWRSQLMTPKVLSGKVEAGMVLIEKVLAEWTGYRNIA
ncbi:hypothetical protein HKX48_003642 [Thoreauomyces humboldtii]|nr:hypothetical protein HKX48_003642 [Thoreauomyces humboldtii]